MEPRSLAFELETARLRLRELTGDDLEALAPMYADPVTMELMLGPRDRAQTAEFIERNSERYRTLGYGLWATVLKENGTLIGRCGLLQQTVDDNQETEVAYLLGAAYWHHGYATEAAAAIRDYAWATLAPSRLVSLIRPENAASQRVSERIGMHRSGRTIVHHGVDHDVWEIAPPGKPSTKK